MTGPTGDELRNTSHPLFLVAGAGIFGMQLQKAAAAQSYEAHAAAMGTSPQEAAAVLREVIDELSATGADGDAYAIAQRRLAEGSDFRPPEELREAARQLLGAHGYSLHPEHVDAYAWKLQRVTAAYAPRVPWYKRWWRRIRNIFSRRKTT